LGGVDNGWLASQPAAYHNRAGKGGDVHVFGKNEEGHFMSSETKLEGGNLG